MKTDNDIENLLMSGNKLSLSVTEKDSIKSVLLEHASATLKHEKRAIPSPWSSWVLRGSVSFASLLIVFVGTAYASQDSLPGEPLYAMKVHVVEEMIALTKTTPEERVAYDIHLMENRLAEIKEIVRQEPETTPEDLVILTDQIDQHVTDVTTTLEEAGSDHIPHGEKIRVLAKLSGVTKAQAKIAKENPELTGVTEAIKETQESTDEALTTTIGDFVTDESAEVVNDYLSDQITDVGEYVNASTTDESSRDTVERHLYDVDEALIDNDATEAITSILEAQQEISTEEYLNIEEGTNNFPAEDTESNHE
jgi:hypothetical protein